MKEIQIDHLGGDMGLTAKVKDAISRASKEFIYIGFLLDEADRLEYYKEGGFESIYEYCEEAFGFKRSSTNNFIRVYRKFGCAMSLQSEYKDYNYSQLVEMSSLDDNKLKECYPALTVRDIRELKRGEKSTYEEIDVPEPSIQTSGRCNYSGDVSYTHVVALECYLKNRFGGKSGLLGSDIKFGEFLNGTGQDFELKRQGELALPVSLMCNKYDIEIEVGHVKAYIPMSVAYWMNLTLCQLSSRQSVSLEPDLEISDMGKCSNCGSLCGLDDNYCSDCGGKIISVIERLGDVNCL